MTWRHRVNPATQIQALISKRMSLQFQLTFAQKACHIPSSQHHHSLRYYIFVRASFLKILRAFWWLCARMSLANRTIILPKMAPPPVPKAISLKNGIALWIEYLGNFSSYPFKKKSVDSTRTSSRKTRPESRSLFLLFLSLYRRFVMAIYFLRKWSARSTFPRW